MAYLDWMDLYFIIFLVFCAVAVLYVLFASLQATARWEKMSEETLNLQRETNDLLREVSRKLDRDQNP